MAMDQRPDDLKPGRLDSYKEWQAAQKIPVIGGFFVKDINEVELAPWDLKGGNAAFVVLDGTGGVNDAQIVEIAPGGKLKPQKHLYEEMVYVTKGVGATTVWQKDGNKKHTFEWGPGSLFAIPLNARYQHFNASGTDTARYFAVTNCCFMINLFHTTDFIFDNEWEFLDRFDPRSEGYFSGKGEVFGRFFMTTNFVPDTHTIGLADYKERGKGTNMKFDLAKNTMGAHISEFPVGTYKKGHRHGPGAHVIVLSGQGYSTLWPEGDTMRRVDWASGSVVVPPDQWFHQHFNSGAKPARYLALRWNNWRFRFMRMQDGEGSTYTSVKQGGGQIEFEDEDPSVHRDFEAAMRKVGARCAMGSYHPGCSVKD